MNNPLIDEVRAARAARAEALDHDPHKIAEWARAAHAERQRILESRNPKKEQTPMARKQSDESGQQAAAHSL